MDSGSTDLSMDPVNIVISSLGSVNVRREVDGPDTKGTPEPAHGHRIVCDVAANPDCWRQSHQRHTIDHVHDCHWPIFLYKFERCIYNAAHIVLKDKMADHLITCDDFLDWKTRNERLGRLDFAWDRSSVLKLEKELNQAFVAKRVEKVRVSSLSPRQVGIELLKKQQEMMSPSSTGRLAVAKVKTYEGQSDEKFRLLNPNEGLWSEDGRSLVTEYDLNLV